MTDKPKRCSFGDHDRVYAPFLLTSNPPQYPWVCRKCGIKGYERGRRYGDSDEYTSICKLFKNSK